MKISQGLGALGRLPAGSAVTVGNFDGMHLGHQRIVGRCRELKEAGAASAVSAITFEPHPLTVLRPQAVPPRLTPAYLKHRLLADAGVDELVELPPSPEVLNLAAEDFWKLLRDGAKAAHMVEGPSFNFGKGRRGTIERLAEWSAASPVKLHLIEPVDVALLDLSIVTVSSSIIRWLLAHGRARDAAICLGRAYILAGPVIKGFQRGKAMGMPTANLQISDQIVPEDGVYAGRCAVDGTTYPAAVSIGSLPTFAERQHQIEAHLIGFDGDLYGRVIEVELLDWLRDQRKFPSVDALKRQMAADVLRSATVGAENRPARPIAVN